MILSQGLDNVVASLRRERGWSQQVLAARSGVSRAEVSAIETGRLSPSTATALKLAAALGVRVESLFSLRGASHQEAGWAWTPATPSGRFWEARVGKRRLRFPVELGPLGTIPHDGCFREHSPGGLDLQEPHRTLVVAGCDPAVGFLAAEVARSEELRVLALTRSSREALSLLGRGLVHAAGVHWSGESGEDANARVVAATLGRNYRLLHLARWQEGVALGASVRTRNAAALARSRLRWVAREEGSGARRCLDRFLGRRSAGSFRRFAPDHRGVALAVRSGWAQAGVAIRLAAEEAGLDFLALEKEDYELCYAESLRGDSVVAALRRALESQRLRKLYRDLPGYDVGRMGEERCVA